MFVMLGCGVNSIVSHSMPPLPNIRHEKFAQALFEGKSATEAYTIAGYHPHQGNSSRLRWFEMVQARLAELQNAAAKKSEVTVESLLAELEHARERADNLDQLSASVKAIEAKAKVSGLLTQRIELNTNASGMTPDDENTTEDVAIYWAKERGVNLSEKELEQFMGLIRDSHASIEQFLASCKAKPVKSADVERKRLGFAGAGSVNYSLTARSVPIQCQSTG